MIDKYLLKEKAVQHRTLTNQINAVVNSSLMHRRSQNLTYGVGGEISKVPRK